MATLVLPPISPRFDISQGTSTRALDHQIRAQTHPCLQGLVKTQLGSVTPAAAQDLSQRKALVINEAKKIFAYAIKSTTDLSCFSLLDIHNLIKYTQVLSKCTDLKEEEKDVLRSLYDRLAQLSVEKWDRRKALGNQVALQRILSPELDALYNELDTNSSLLKDEDFQVRMSIAKAELSTRMGVGIHAAGSGVNGAQIIKSLEGDAVGVFKPENKLAWYDVIGVIKRFFGQARLLCNKKLVQEFAEVAAHKLSKVMGFHITPAAKMCQIRNKEGAFLAFLSGYKEAKDVIETIETKARFTENECTLFQRMAAYDFLTGNMDCHDGNWFVRMDGDEITEIRVIDHGNSFIESNPGMGLLGNQYKWGRLRIAQEEFTKEFVDFVKGLTEEGLEAFIKETRGEFLNAQMEALTRERFWTLKMGVLSGQIQSPKDLSRIHTDHDFMACRLEITKRLKAEGKTEGDLLIVDVTSK